MGVGVLRLGGRGGLASADGPDRLVGDDGFEQLLCAHAGEATAQLGFQDLLFLPASRSSSVSPTQRIGFSSLACAASTFLLMRAVRLSEDLAPLAVADDDVLHEELAQHGRADLTGVGAGSFEVKVLRSEADLLRTSEEF